MSDRIITEQVPISGDIPEEVRTRTLSKEFSWVQNVDQRIYNENESERLSKHELGRPKATERYSEAELIKMGMAGMYRRSGPA